MEWIKRGAEDTVEKIFLRNIGVKSLDDVNAWFKKSNAGGYRINSLGLCRTLIAAYKGRHIVIVGDYDADGCCATSILLLGLKACGCEDVAFRIPKRFSEGFGVSERIVDEIPQGSLVITCDNGIAFPEVIAKAKAKDCKVILTDHHLPKMDEKGNAVLPDADVIIDPNALKGSADFNGYCGAGLAYALVRELLGNDDPVTQKCLTLAAIATVADVVPLREENYVIVRKGLKRLTDSTMCTAGLWALIQELGLADHCAEGDIGFSIAPCINACSRMSDDGAKDAVRALSYDGPIEDVTDLARHMVEVNKDRKIAKEIAIKNVEDKIADKGIDTSHSITVDAPMGLGIIGIVAGYLAEKYQVPSIVFTKAKDGLLRGSARSAGGFDIKACLDKCASALLYYGGHPGAAGLTIKPENYDKFKSLFKKATEDFIRPGDSASYDLEIDAGKIPAYATECAKYAPYGEGNPEPVFLVRDFDVIPSGGRYAAFLGSDGSTVKLASLESDAIGFRQGDVFAGLKDEPRKLDLIGTLGFNVFRGNVRAQVEFSDFRLACLKKTATPLAEMLRRAAAS